MLTKIRKELQSRSEQRLIERKLKFFQCHKGGYGEGDCFLGIDNPNVRATAKIFKDITLQNIASLLSSEYHEERLLGLVIMDLQYIKSEKKKTLNPEHQKHLYKLYLNKVNHINNWDLIDLSAPNIVGKYLLARKDERKTIYKLAKSGNLWKERIAILATYTFIRNNDFSDTLKLAEQFINHEHDLMHKATGWMLREIGNRDFAVEEKFLKKYYLEMPRTALRYAIEKFPEDIRLAFLQGKI